MINVLYLDDEAHNLTAFRAAFRRDFQVHVTTEPTDAVRILREHPIEVIISDQKMPKLSGVEFFELIAPDYPDPVRMLLTGHADIDAVIDAINKGQIYKYIAKPWNESELRDLVTEGVAAVPRPPGHRPAGRRPAAADEQSGAGSCENSIPDGGQNSPNRRRDRAGV